jgi:glycine oxidase
LCFEIHSVNGRKTVDYIIVGQGLAGSCLAMQFILRNKTVIVFDQPADNHASAVAAGLFNPITGKVMAKTWLADTLFPSLRKFYTEAEQFFGQKFFFPMPLYRPFGSVQEQNGWMGKSADVVFADYIEAIFLQSTNSGVVDPFGGLLLKQCGYVDVNAFLQAMQNHLTDSMSYQEERFDEQELSVSSEGLSYGNIDADRLIFCNGIQCTKSTYFSWLPVNPLKGETVQAQIEMPVNYILNRGVYVVPGRGENEYTVGATYDFTSKSPGITREGRIELELKLRELVSFPFSVSSQNWGIRPTSLDQKLIMGPHPRWGNVIIFNGLGTKGVSLAPYFSAHLAAWLEGECEIMPEVNIERYKSLYSKFE